MIDLHIEGMTCASCVARIEHKLGKLEGVQASVNLPLESAQVTVPSSVTDQQIIDTVIATGCSARLKASAGPVDGVAPARDAGPATEPAESERQGAAAALRPRLLLAIVLTLPVAVISMVPAAQFPHWGCWVFALSLPVVTWAAWPFHRSAAINARHLASTMDTLVSIGVVAAVAFSGWQLVADPAMTAHVGMGTGGHVLYFEVAAVVTTFLLLGRIWKPTPNNAPGMP